MAAYTIEDENWTKETLKTYYENAKSKLTLDSWDDLDIIFDTALNSPGLFPGIKGVNSVCSYIERWVKSYHDAHLHLPSKRIATPKTSCSDPAVRLIVQNTQGLDSDTTINGELTHNLFMNAENIQGNLLEEYISNNIRKYGFLWCKGNTLRAIDFCSKDGMVLLQVKNKSNTENSSSKNIRSGTTIIKWHRLGTKTVNKKKVPNYKWDDLNTLVNKFRTEGLDLKKCNLSENSYIDFLSEVTSSNRDLITDK